MKAGKYRLAGKRKPEQDLFFKRALEARGWSAGGEQAWDACWYTGMPDASEFRNVGPGRTINHIPGNSALTIKSRLYESVSAMRERVSLQLGPRDDAVARLDFLPRVYSMPADYHRLQQAALDDPGQRWILKPKNASRGRGIRVVSDIARVPMEPSWMVQQYLANPHTMRQRKYVLRLYVLVSDIDPLRVYLHRQGFAKLASAPYDVNDVDNPFSQLTNPDINALNAGAEVPVEFVDLDRYRQWLREQGHDDERLFEQIRDLVTLTVISAVETMRRQAASCGADTRGCYELLGLDCLIDDQLKPWILECNLSPSLGVCAAPDGGADIEERVKAQVVSDTVSLVGIGAPQPQPPSGDPAERIRALAREELARAGGFQRLWPAANASRYLPYFALPRLADVALVEAASGGAVARPRFARLHAEELIIGERLALYDQRSGRLEWMNDSASFIWLMAVQGADPDAIAEQLHGAAGASGGGGDPWVIRKDVWDCLATWVDAGKLARETTPTPAEAPCAPVARDRPAPTPESITMGMRCGVCRMDVATASAPVAARLQDLSLLRSETGDRNVPRLEILCDTPGYTLVLDGDVVASRLTLAAVVPAISERLARLAAGEGQLTIDVGLVDGRGSGDVAFARANGTDTFALIAAERLQRGFARGLMLDAGRPELAMSLGLPGRRDEGRAGAGPAGLPGSRDIGILVFPRTGTTAQTAPIAVLPVEEAVSELLPACSMGGGRPADASVLPGLVDWLRGRRLYSLDISDPERALEALQQKIHAPLVARASARCDSTRDRQESTA
ncbi:MAG: amylase [Lysobacter sp.]|nr:amylase [Lysobacter sp.]MDQ3269592.1 amylase [Pseudomonadota bacterium]